MVYRLGLKLWSVNTDYYYEEAKRLYGEGVFDYIELYVVPNTLDTLAKWKELRNNPLRHSVPLPPEGAEVLVSTCKRKYSPYMKDFARKLRKNMTKQEVIFWQQIRKNKLGERFRRQHSIDDKYIADFYCHEKRLIIEIDGGQHCQSFNDEQRTFYLENRGYRIIRFWNNEIDEKG